MAQDKLKEYDLTDEQWREYDWEYEPGKNRVYKIYEPKSLFYVKGASTHRVLDIDGVVHCVPTVGNMGCVLRWKVKDGKNPVAF